MFVHLHAHSCYSFTDGADEPETLVKRAAELGMPALALTDHDSTAAAVKFVAACRQYHVRPVLGAELTMESGTHSRGRADTQLRDRGSVAGIGTHTRQAVVAHSHLTLLAETPQGYANLNRLISISHERGGRRTPALPWEELGLHCAGLICLTGCRRGVISTLVRLGLYDEAKVATRRLLDLFGTANLFVELEDDMTPASDRVCRELAHLARRSGIGAVATNNVHYAEQGGYIAHDLLRCIAAGITLNTPHESRPLNRERYLKSQEEMLDRFEWLPMALEQSGRIAERCGDVLPSERITPIHPSGNAPQLLRELSYQGARERYGARLPKALAARIRERLEHELGVIESLGFCDYMLTCRDIVAWTRSQRITCTGRGSAADSCVAYCLRLTDVDVIERNLPFARFLTPGKIPDVDLDFPSHRREDVYRHVQSTYGVDKVAVACAFSTFRARAAVRDTAKVLGFPAEVVGPLAERLGHKINAAGIAGAFDTAAELTDQKHLKARFETLFDLCGRIAGLPRHISSHPCGVVISRVPLHQVGPTIPSASGVLPILTLDKDDVEEAGAVKLDLLALRIHSATEDAEEDIQRRMPEWTREGSIPRDDRRTFAMMQRGHSIGVFQFESPAQMALAQEMLPGATEDLTAAVSLIRPANNRSGASVLNTVRKYLDARGGYTPIVYAHPVLRPILARTFGCVIYQESVTDVVGAMTGWSDSASEQFRKRLTKHTRAGTLDKAADEFVSAAMAYLKDLSFGAAATVWNEIKGWGTYGFTEGHSASFAQIGYESAYMSVHEPAAYFAGLLNHQPMGFYPPLTLVAEARRRGVAILPIDVNESGDKSISAIGYPAIRLGLRLVARLSEDEIAAVETARADASNGRFASLLDFCVRVVLRRDALDNLVLCGAFDGIEGLHRRGLMLRLDETLTLAAAYRGGVASTIASGVQAGLPFGSWADVATPCAIDVPELSEWDKLLWEWRISGVCTSSHPVGMLRDRLDKSGVFTVREAMSAPTGSRVTIAGLNIRPHRPPTRTGTKVLFTTVEDETDYMQIVVIGEAIETTTAVFLLSPAVIVQGTIERRGNGVSLKVERAKTLRQGKE